MGGRMPYKAVIFDLDGTLLDTIEDLADSMNFVLESAGFRGYPAEDYKYFVGSGMRHLITRVLPEHVQTEENIEYFQAKIEEEYRKRSNIRTKPYKGIPELLKGLEASGIPMSVLSNKPHDLTVLTINEYFPGHRFAAILGARPDVPKKPDPASALGIASILNLPPSEIVYLGDTGIDMMTSKAAGMFAVGALWGFRTADELVENGADALIEKPEDLLGFFR